MADRCPSCFIRLPLSGEANCDCEPPSAPGAAVAAPLGDQGPILALVDPQSPDSAPEALDEDDHRPRHDGKGWHWSWSGTGWTSGDGYVLVDLLEIEANFGPVTFCDCQC